MTCVHLKQVVGNLLNIRGCKGYDFTAFTQKAGRSAGENELPLHD